MQKGKCLKRWKTPTKLLRKAGSLRQKRNLAADLDQIDIKDTKERPKPLKESLIRTTEWLEKQFKLQEEEMLLTTRLPALNRIIGGLMPQDLIFVAARPSVGKNSFLNGFG